MFGIECYLSGHKGFQGIIKQSWKDFKVTELDESGKLVQMEPVIVQTNQEAIVKQSTECLDNTLQTCTPKSEPEVSANIELHDCRQLTQQSTIDNSNEKFSLNKASFAPPSSKRAEWRDVANPKESLRQLLGGTSFDSLEVFAENMKQKKDHLITFSLGQFDDKDSRFTVHLCVKKLYPHLKTASKKNEQIGNHEITVEYNAVHGELSTMLGSEDADRVIWFVHCEDKNKNVPLNLSIDQDRNHRTLVHRLLSKYFGSFLESKTLTNDKNGTCHVQMRFRQKMKRSHSGKPLNSDKEIYTAFVLYKENMETLEAINVLCRYLDTKPSAFSYAGTKDKKAVTLQSMVVRGVTPKKLISVHHNGILNMRIGHVTSCDGPLKLGQLGGNHFRIIIRNVKSAETQDLTTVIQEAVQNVKSQGFVNYFGPQRFGLESKTIQAHHIGLAILQGDMEKAINLFFTPASEDSEDSVDTAKRYFVETGDVPGTLDKMPNYKTRECLILKALHRHGKDQDGCTKALLNIPYSMRLLYLHSYSSLIWNEMASHRLKVYGPCIVPGDLVVDKNCTNSKESRLDKGSIREVTTEEIQSGSYTFQDVVLPQPGYNIKYPNNSMEQRYSERMLEDGISADCFRVRKLSLNVPGAYRKLISYPKDLTWSWCTQDLHLQERTNKEEIFTSLSPKYVGIPCKRQRISHEVVPSQNWDSQIQPKILENSRSTGSQENQLSCSQTSTEINHSKTQESFPDSANPELEMQQQFQIKSTLLDNSCNVDTCRNQDINTSCQVDYSNQDQDISSSPKRTRTLNTSNPQEHVAISFTLDVASYATICLRELLKS